MRKGPHARALIIPGTPRMMISRRRSYARTERFISVLTFLRPPVRKYPHAVLHHDPYSRGDGRTCPPWPAALRAGEPTHEGFAGPNPGDLWDPCSPSIGLHPWVCWFRAGWPTQTLNRLLGPGNRHSVLDRLTDRLRGLGPRVKGAGPQASVHPLSAAGRFSRPEFILSWNARPCSTGTASIPRERRRARQGLQHAWRSESRGTYNPIPVGPTQA